VTLKPGLGVIQGHRNRCGSICYCLWLPINVSKQQGPISYRFRDKRQFSMKTANFSHPAYFALHWRGSPGNWVSAFGVKKTRVMELLGREKVRRYLQPSGYNTPTWWTDGRTMGWQQRPGGKNEKVINTLGLGFVETIPSPWLSHKSANAKTVESRSVVCKSVWDSMEW